MMFSVSWWNNWFIIDHVFYLLRRYVVGMRKICADCVDMWLAHRHLRFLLCVRRWFRFLFVLNAQLFQLHAIRGENGRKCVLFVPRSEPIDNYNDFTMENYSMTKFVWWKLHFKHWQTSNIEINLFCLLFFSRLFLLLMIVYFLLLSSFCRWINGISAFADNALINILYCVN